MLPAIVIPFVVHLLSCSIAAKIETATITETNKYKEI